MCTGTLIKIGHTSKPTSSSPWCLSLSLSLESLLTSLVYFIKQFYGNFCKKTELLGSVNNLTDTISIVCLTNGMPLVAFSGVHVFNTMDKKLHVCLQNNSCPCQEAGKGRTSDWQTFRSVFFFSSFWMMCALVISFSKSWPIRVCQCILAGAGYVMGLILLLTIRISPVTKVMLHGEQC